ncbi:MAG: hypothetical protein KDA25_01230 [Phycisphaerales bacterium]|nr:hypothetical protein [Phycisphaerales bacterium]
MTSLAVVASPDDVLALRESAPAALDGHVLALDVDVHLALVAEGIAPLTPWSVVDHDDVPRLEAIERELVATWSAAAVAMIDGVNLFDLGAHRHRAFLARAVWLAFVIEAALVRVAPERVVTLTPPLDAHGLEPAPGVTRIALLDALVADLAAGRACAVEVAARLDRDPGDRFGATGAGERPPIDLDDLADGTTPLVVFHANGGDLSRQAPVIRRLVDDHDVRVLRVHRTGDPDATPLDNVVTAHESQVSGPHAFTATDRVRLGASRERFEAALGASSAAMRCGYGGAAWRSHLDFLFGDYAARMTWHVRAWTRLVERLRPAAVVTNSPVPLFDVAVARDVPGLLLPHGAMLMGADGWFDAAPRATLGALGVRHASRLRSRGVDASRLVTVGEPSLAAFRADLPSRSDPIVQAWRTSVGAAADDGVVLALTAPLGAPANRATLPRTDWAVAIEDVRRLAAALDARPGRRLVIRDHPVYGTPRLYDDLAARWSCVHMESESPLAVAIAGADVVVVLNELTSSLVEASCGAAPVILLTSAMPWCDHDAWGTDRWPRATTVDRLVEWIDGALGDGNCVEQLRRATKEALAALVDGAPEDAVGAAARAVDAIVRPPAPLVGEEPVACGSTPSSRPV